MAKLFFSYSHRDADLRDELETHLVALKREGVLETWHDRRIGAGKEFANEISRHLATLETSPHIPPRGAPGFVLVQFGDGTIKAVKATTEEIVRAVNESGDN